MRNRASEIRTASGLNRTAFCRKYGIPARTEEDWEAGRRVPPDYVINWLERIVKEDLQEKK